MAKTVIIDEWHLTLRVPANLRDDAAERVRQTLAGADFMNRLRKAIRLVARAFPELVAVRLSVTR